MVGGNAMFSSLGLCLLSPLLIFQYCQQRIYIHFLFLFFFYFLFPTPTPGTWYTPTLGRGSLHGFARDRTTLYDLRGW